MVEGISSSERTISIAVLFTFRTQRRGVAAAVEAMESDEDGVVVAVEAMKSDEDGVVAAVEAMKSDEDGVAGAVIMVAATDRSPSEPRSVAPLPFQLISW